MSISFENPSLKKDSIKHDLEFAKHRLSEIYSREQHREFRALPTGWMERCLELEKKITETLGNLQKNIPYPKGYEPGVLLSEADNLLMMLDKK